MFVHENIALKSDRYSSNMRLDIQSQITQKETSFSFYHF